MNITAAPLSEEILRLLQKKFPDTGFKQGYGMTESCSCITAHPPTHYGYEHAHKVGMIVASTTVKIIDEDGNELGINEPGGSSSVPHISSSPFSSPSSLTLRSSPLPSSLCRKILTLKSINQNSSPAVPK